MITRNTINSRRSRPIPMHIGTVMAFTLALSCAVYGQTTHYVDDDNCPAPGTGSLVDPYCSIQVAIDASVGGDTIEVAPGTYFEDINFLGKAITLRSRDGAATTIIDATFVPAAGETVSVVRCVNGETATTVLDGFTITGGTGTTFSMFEINGGGMFNDGSSPTVTNCIFSGNKTGNGSGMYNGNTSNPTVINCTFNDNIASFGGGIYNSFSSPTITDCSFSRNMVNGGGGIFNVDSSPNVSDCEFIGNEASSGGGILNDYRSNPIVTNCIFNTNTVTGAGGGMYSIAANPTIIDSMFIENNADSSGGGMYNESETATVTNCTFIGNTAGSGGGMDNRNGTPVITDCIFSGNISDSNGGGMFNIYSSPRLDNCEFNGNTAGSDGGGIYGSYGNLSLTDCSFSQNTSYRSGGGMASFSLESTLMDCTFNGNTANGHGGGIADSSGNLTLTNCTLIGNSAMSGDGGGISHSGFPSSLSVSHCTINGNSARNGGGLYADQSSLTLVNSSFSGNISSNDGGGIYNVFVDSTSMTNCTISGNMAKFSGGGMRLGNSSSSTLSNCILWGNLPDDLDKTNSLINPRTIAFSNIGGSRGSGRDWIGEMGKDGRGNIDIDPLFFNPLGVDGIIGTADDDLRILHCSPSIDAADHDTYLNAGGGPTDLDDGMRVIDNTIVPNTGAGSISFLDMGAYEIKDDEFGFTQTTRLVDDDNCPNSGDGSLGDPYCAIQDAIEASLTCDIIEVAPGTYYESINLLGKLITLRSSDGPMVTTIDASNVPDSGSGVPVVRCVNGETAATVLDGFTITGGTGDTSRPSESEGGGMYISGSSPTVTNCVIIRNTADVGGGMYIIESGPTLVNCSLIGNSADFGGGIFNFSSPDSTFTNCIFSGNTALTRGGGLYNSAYSHATVTNCTFSGNTASNGGGIASFIHSEPTYTNCILWGNSPNEILNWDHESIPTFTYSIVQGGLIPRIDGGNNLDTDPLFVDPLGLDGIAGTDDDDLRLSEGSPAIDTGDDAAFPLGVTTDVSGSPRHVCELDMGAYEYQSHYLPVNNITQDKFFCTIQQCVDAAVDGDECVVPPSTYYEAIDFLGKAITVRSRDGADTTIIDASTISTPGRPVPVVRCVNRETAATVLDGFTITGGTGELIIPRGSRSSGGGIYNESSSPTVINCTIEGNMADLYGGGMYNISSNPSVIKCIFSGNMAGIQGGGMYNEDSNPMLSNCKYIDNKANFGGGLFNYNFSSPTLTNCLFSGNTANTRGGGLYNFTSSNPMIKKCAFIGNKAIVDSGGGMYNRSSSSPTLTNCIFSGNIADVDGGGMYNSDLSSPTLTNCTFNGNIASSGNGGGMVNYDQSFPTFTNSILWGDLPDEIFNDIGNPTFSYCDIQGSGGSAAWDTLLGTDGGGNIDADPLFINPLGADGMAGTIDDDLRLMLGSPCIDAGDYGAYLATGGGLTDLDGKDRVIDNIDIVDTGVGVLTYLDMGAYEEGSCHDDGIFSLDDLVSLETCITGPGVGLNLGCACVDLDVNEHVDLRDYATFQLAFNP